jgi:hypothetical protein
MGDVGACRLGETGITVLISVAAADRFVVALTSRGSKLAEADIRTFAAIRRVAVLERTAHVTYHFSARHH